MEVPPATPVGLTDEFAQDTSRQALWRAFLRKSGLKAASLDATVAFFCAKLLLPLSNAYRLASDDKWPTSIE